MHARSVEHHVQFGQFFPTVKRFVVESSYRSKSVLARQDGICSVADREGLLIWERLALNYHGLH